MALIKEIQHPSGIPVLYWKATNPQFDFDDNVVRVMLKGYVSQQARLENKEPLALSQHVIPMFKPESGGDIRDSVYAALKKDKVFENAEDA